MSGARRLPPRVTLPVGGAVELRAAPGAKARPRAPGAPLFSEVLSLFDEGAAHLSREGAPLDVRTLALADFHVVRALLARAGLVEEPPVEITCRNCDAPLTVTPCAGLEVGPYVHGELADEELDATLPFGAPHEVPPLSLGRVRTASTITLRPLTVRDAEPLFAALAKPSLSIDEDFVRAMGVEALGAERSPAKIARALSDCDDEAFAAVGEVFLASHYAPRLASVVFCGPCGARNDVDAPYERELEPAALADRSAAGAEFPSFDAFSARAAALAEPMLADVPGDPVELVVEGGTAAVDDGGEPLLGSYVPPHPGDLGSPTRPPTVTLYFQTFRAMWQEDGPYDWEAEVRETVEHELEHHVHFLRGEDPLDDEERDVIRREGLRIVGRREAGRRALVDFGDSLGDFMRRTWPLWVLALAAVLLMLLAQR